MTRTWLWVSIIAAMGVSLACEANRQTPAGRQGPAALPASSPAPTNSPRGPAVTATPTPAPTATSPNPAASAPAPAPVMKDGVWTGSGRGFRGDVEAAVTIKDGQITAVDVTKHNDDAPFFDRAKAITKNIVDEQRTNVDAVTGATFSSRGIQWAVWRALQKAKGLPTSGPAQ